MPQPQPDNTDVGNAENLFLHLRWPQTDSESRSVRTVAGGALRLSSLTRLPRRLSPAIVESLLEAGPHDPFIRAAPPKVASRKKQQQPRHRDG